MSTHLSQSGHGPSSSYLQPSVTLEPSPHCGMNIALTELKIRAKKLLKQHQHDDVIARNFTSVIQKHRWDMQREIQLKDCQNLLAIRCGFRDWQHGYRVLAGKSGVDVGSFFHSVSCDAFINLWFAHYDQAKRALTQTADTFLVPYKRQFVVVRKDYLRAIGLTDDVITDWQNHRFNAVEGYGHSVWDKAAEQVVRYKTQLR